MPPITAPADLLRIDKLDPTSAMRTLPQRLIAGGAWALAGMTVYAGAGVLATSLLARLLTPGEIGAYFLAVSIVSVAAGLAQLGMDRVLVRLVAEAVGVGRFGRAKKTIRQIFQLNAVGAITVAALIAGTGSYFANRLFHSPPLASASALIATSVLVFSLQNLIAQTFRGFNDIRGATALDMGSNLFFALMLAGLWLSRRHGQFPEVLAMRIVAGCLAAIIAAAILRRKIASLVDDGTSVTTREILAASIPLLISTVATLVLMQVDLWIVAAFRSGAEVGLYGAALRLALLIALPLRLINWVAAPLIAEYYERRQTGELERNLRAAAALASIPSSAALTLCVAGGSFVLGHLYGPFYAQATWALTLLSLGQCATVWLGSCNVALVMTGHQNSMMSITVISGLMSVALSLLLVGRFGIEGVALASAAGSVAQSVWMVARVKASTGIWTYASFRHLGSVIKEFRARSEPAAASA